MSNASSQKHKIAPGLREAVKMTEKKLHDTGIAEFAQEARLLVCHAIGIDSISLITKPSMTLNSHQIELLSRLTTKRMTGLSISRIKGGKEFYGLQLQLSRDVLEPRADTETLVDAVLADMRGYGDEHIKILDMGTGSGAIIISLLCNLPNALGIASDIGVSALSLAAKNAAMHAIDNRILFVQANWSEGIQGPFNAIVSNPPYIKSGIISSLAREVRNNDPLSALDGGKDGLESFRNIFIQCSLKLHNMGKLYLETGYDQAKEVCALANKKGWNFVKLIKDLSGNDRVLVFERQSET